MINIASSLLLLPVIERRELLNKASSLLAPNKAVALHHNADLQLERKLKKGMLTQVTDSRGRLVGPGLSKRQGDVIA